MCVFRHEHHLAAHLFIQAGLPFLCGCTEAVGVLSAPSCRNSHHTSFFPLVYLPQALWGFGDLLCSLTLSLLDTAQCRCFHAQSGGQGRHTLSCSSVHDWGWQGGAASRCDTQQSYCVNSGAVELPCKQMAPTLAGFCAASSPHSLEGRGPLFLKPLPSAPLSTHITNLQAGLMLRKSAVVRASLEPCRGHVPCRDLALSRVVPKEIVEGCSGSPFRTSRSHPGLASQF